MDARRMKISKHFEWVFQNFECATPTSLPLTPCRGSFKLGVYSRSTALATATTQRASAQYLHRFARLAFMDVMNNV